MVRMQMIKRTASLALSAVLAFSSVLPDTYAHAEETLEAVDIQDVSASGAEDSGVDASAGYDGEILSADEEDFVSEDEILTEEEIPDEYVLQDDAGAAYPEEDPDDPFAGLIEDMDEVPEENGSVEVEAEDGMSVEDPFAPGNPSGDSGAEDGLLMAASAKRASGSFGSSYGEQLDDLAAYLYGVMADHYVNEHESGDWSIPVSPSGIEISVHVDDLAEYRTDPAWTEYKTGYLKYNMQSAINAVSYDFPQIFWERTTNITWSLTLINDDEGEGGTVRVNSLNMKTTASYTDAPDDIDAFFAAVDSAVSRLRSSCDYTGDGVITDTEYAKGAHDFACSALWYDSNTLSVYRSYPENKTAYRIFTPAPAFVPALDGGGVCEAYSRTVKVLLDRLGVQSALISGSDHMWNGVCIDGAWYLLDATWDDSESGVPSVYYLLSNPNSRHAASGCLTGTGSEQVFAVPPVLSGRAPHTFGEWNITGEATCLADGSRERTCGICNYTESEAVTNGPHNFTDWNVTTPATCTRQGEKSRSCTLCGRTETEQIAATGHSFGEWTVKIPATCTDKGTEESSCTACGETKTREIPAAGHSFGKWTVSKEASCTEKGTETRKCSACGETQSRDIEAKGHSYVKTVVAPTCTEDGYTLYTCGRCGDSYRENPVKASGHSYVKDASKSAPATCVSDGEDVLVCGACGAEKREKTAKTGHKWGGWRISAAATVWSPAVQERKCSACGAVETGKTGASLTPKMTLNAYSIALRKKQKTTKIKVSGLAAGDSVKSWTSSNTGIATCGAGWIKAGKKTGTAYVTITTKAGASARIAVKVQKAKVAVSGISVVAETITQKRGETFDLKTAVSPLTTEYPAKYSSSKKKTATVSKKGIIKAKKSGNCVITVKCGKKKVKVKVRVTP